MLYIVVYDITKPKRLRKIAKYLEGIGIRVQNSTFEIDSNIVQKPLNSIFEELISLCNEEEKDSLFMYKIKNKEDLQQETSFWEMVF